MSFQLHYIVLTLPQINLDEKSLENRQNEKSEHRDDDQQRSLKNRLDLSYTINIIGEHSHNGVQIHLTNNNQIVVVLLPQASSYSGGGGVIARSYKPCESGELQASQLQFWVLHLFLKRKHEDKLTLVSIEPSDWLKSI